jgi:hypothetical protein
MTSVIADEKMSSVLSQLTTLSEVRDTHGKIIGFFAPAPLENSELRIEVAAHVTPEEIQRRKAARLPGFTTREVFERLKSLTADEPTQNYLQKLIEL